MKGLRWSNLPPRGSSDGLGNAAKANVYKLLCVLWLCLTAVTSCSVPSRLVQVLLRTHYCFLANDLKPFFGREEFPLPTSHENQPSIRFDPAAVHSARNKASSPKHVISSCLFKTERFEEFRMVFWTSPQVSHNIASSDEQLRI